MRAPGPTDGIKTVLDADEVDREIGVELLVAHPRRAADGNMGQGRVANSERVVGPHRIVCVQSFVRRNGG